MGRKPGLRGVLKKVPAHIPVYRDETQMHLWNTLSPSISSNLFLRKEQFRFRSISMIVSLPLKTFIHRTRKKQEGVKGKKIRCLVRGEFKNWSYDKRRVNLESENYSPFNMSFSVTQGRPTCFYEWRVSDNGSKFIVMVRLRQSRAMIRQQDFYGHSVWP